MHYLSNKDLVLALVKVIYKAYGFFSLHSNLIMSYYLAHFNIILKRYIEIHIDNFLEDLNYENAYLVNFSEV